MKLKFLSAISDIYKKAKQSGTHIVNYIPEDSRPLASMFAKCNNIKKATNSLHIFYIFYIFITVSTVYLNCFINTDIHVFYLIK